MSNRKLPICSYYPRIALNEIFVKKFRIGCTGIFRTSVFSEDFHKVSNRNKFDWNNKKKEKISLEQ